MVVELGGRESMKPTGWAIVPEKFWRCFESVLWFFHTLQGYSSGDQQVPSFKRYIWAAGHSWYWGERRDGRL